MKSETFVCIVPSPTIPLGSKARWHEGGATYHIYTPSDDQIWISQTKTPHDDIIELGALCLTREQVEQNPECWRKEYKRGEGWEVVGGKVVHVEHPLDKRFVMMREEDARKELSPDPLPRPDGKAISKIEYYEDADGNYIPVTYPENHGHNRN